MLTRVELSTDRRSAVLAAPHPGAGVALDEVPVVGLRHREHRRVVARVALVTATCVASAVLGLAISSLVRPSEQIMPLFVVAVMPSWCCAAGWLR